MPLVSDSDATILFEFFLEKKDKRRPNAIRPQRATHTGQAWLGRTSMIPDANFLYREWIEHASACVVARDRTSGAFVTITDTVGFVSPSASRRQERRVTINIILILQVWVDQHDEMGTSRYNDDPDHCSSFRKTLAA
jgi:hypothetical protein